MAKRSKALEKKGIKKSSLYQMERINDLKSEVENLEVMISLHRQRKSILDKVVGEKAKTKPKGLTIHLPSMLRRGKRIKYDGDSSYFLQMLASETRRLKNKEQKLKNAHLELERLKK